MMQDDVNRYVAEHGVDAMLQLVTEACLFHSTAAHDRGDEKAAEDWEQMAASVGDAVLESEEYKNLRPDPGAL
jgi:hypothetical protein